MIQNISFQPNKRHRNTPTTSRQFFSKVEIITTGFMTFLGKLKQAKQHKLFYILYKTEKNKNSTKIFYNTINILTKLSNNK